MGTKKYHIEKNTVQETLVIPLYGKKICSETYPDFFYDKSAIEIYNNIDYDFSKMKNNFISRFGTVEAGMRSLDLAYEINDYIKDHPDAVVVNLGCGLDDSFSRIDNGKGKGYNLDYPDVIEIRNELLPPKAREINLSADLNNYEWMKKIDYNENDGIVFIASGVFYYFKTEEVLNLFDGISKVFKNFRISFDIGNKKALKLMLKTYIKGSDMKIDAFFYVNSTDLLQSALPHLKISSKGYMTGYKKLDKSMPWFYRKMADIGDNMYGLRIIRIES